MRLLRRNALGVYAVYAAAIVSGLVVTPIVIHSIGTPAFGVWSFIGAVTIYLSVLDLGVGPSIVRFAAEARAVARRARKKGFNRVECQYLIHCLQGLRRPT